MTTAPCKFTVAPQVFDTTLPGLLGTLRERWARLPDHRRPNNNTQDTIGDAAMSALRNMSKSR